MRKYILQKFFVRTFFVLFLGLVAAATAFGQSPFTINVNGTFSNGTIAGSGGVTYNSNVFTIPASSTYDYILTGTTTARKVTIASGYHGTITLSNLSITSTSTNSSYGISGISCITVEGQNNQSNLNPVTIVHFILEGTNSLSYNANSGYCPLQVNQGAQIHINAIDSTDNNSGTLSARYTGNSPSSYGGAGIGAPNFASGTNNTGQGTATIYCVSGSAGRTTTAGGNIIIGSGTVTAQGGHGAGIGGGWYTYYDGIIVIYGGIVNATAGYHAAGIGSGCPTGSGVTSCYGPNSMVVALPPAQISACGKAGNANTCVVGLELAGATNITYIGDPNKPLLTVFTEDTTPNANIYLDLTLTPRLVSNFASVGLGWYNLAAVNVGTTDAVTGMLSFRGEFQQNTTFFTDASSIKPATIGRPFMPVVKTVLGTSANRDTTILPLLLMNISFTDYPSIPLDEGYTGGEAEQRAFRTKVSYNDHDSMTNIVFSMQYGVDFSSLIFLAADSMTVIPPPTRLDSGDVFYIVVPINTGKTLNTYTDVLQMIGDWQSVSLPAPIRKVVQQRVMRPDTSGLYIKVSAVPTEFVRIYPTSEIVTMSLLITHWGLTFPYDTANVIAKYLVTTEPNYIVALSANPLATWSSLTIPLADSTTANTVISFNGKPTDTYYIHWYVESGILYANSQVIGSGGFGPYIILDSVKAGTISGANVCDGYSVTLTGAASTGGNGDYTYTWQSSTTSSGPWTDIPNSDSLNHTTGILAAGTYYFRRYTNDSITIAGTTYFTDSDTSNVVSITVYPAPPPTITDSLFTYLKYSTVPSLVSATGATPTSGYTLQWYLSDGVTPYTDANNPTNTDTEGEKTYYVSQKNNATGCESGKIPVSVITVSSTDNIACPGATVSLDIWAGWGINLYLFDVQTGGVAISSEIGNVSPPQTFWIEPRIGATVYPRVPITIELSQSCGGTPVGCAAEGTVIFREDFGGNSPSDPARSITPLGLATTYVFQPSGPLNPGEYGLMKYGSGSMNTDWHEYDDHTYPGDTTRGYYMLVRSDFDGMRLYEIHIDSLPVGVELYFSAWVGNLSIGTYPDPNFYFLAFDDSTSTHLATYTTGEVPYTLTPEWKQYGFKFKTISSSTSFQVETHCRGSYSLCDNRDFALDDIEVRLCAPPVTLMPSPDTSVCIGYSLTLSGEYTDDGTFGSALIYRWEHSLSGDINDPNAWTTLSTFTGTSPLSVTYPIASMSGADTGYYRLLVGNAATIDHPKYRAASTPTGVWMNVTPIPTLSDSLLAYWQYEAAASLLFETGATAEPGHTLQWYLSDTTTVHTGANAPIYTDTVGIQTFFVSQINNTTNCESDKVPVSVIIVKPQAMNYAVCPASEVTLGVGTMAGISFYWFAAQTGGSALSGPSNTYYIASAAPPQTFWIEPRMGATIYARIPIYVTLSPYCGNLTPVGCAETGTLIYKEDFRGNNVSDPVVSPVDLIGGRSDLVFNGSTPGSGDYGLIKYNSSQNVFLYNYDHTYLGDRTRGYFMYIDPAPSQMNAILYEYDILGLCSDIMGMSFTVWMVDLQTGAAARPKIEMQILDMNTGDVITTTGTFMIPRQAGSGQNPSNPVIWRQYGFNFDLPSGISDITFRLINKEVNNIGNDWAMDDIEIRLCAPPVTLTPAVSDTFLCAGSSLTISGEYTDDGTFGSPLTYRWEHSLTGDINDPNAWTTISTSTDASPLNVTHSISSMSDADTGYYRLLVGTSTSIDQPNCRASSEPIGVWLHPAPAPALSDSLLVYLQYEAAPSLLAATGASALAGHTLQWYLSDTTTVYTDENDPIYTDTSGIQTFFVSQINNTTNCESDKIPIHIIVLKPQALNYFVCPDEEVVLGVDTIAGVDFYWYADSTGGTALNASPADTFRITGTTFVQTFWVEAQLNSFVFTRIPIIISLNYTCGGVDPRAGCLMDGTTLYKRDFGGNDVSDPKVSPTGLPAGSSDLPHYPGYGSTAGHYLLTKNPHDLAPLSFLSISDHTYPNDTTRGYMMFLDPDYGDLNKVLYQTDIDSLCEGMTLSFTGWFIDINPNPASIALSPMIQMQMVNKTNGVILASTGDIVIPKGSSWRQYGFDFELPAGVSNVNFRIINRLNTSAGNDWAMDDIEVRVCIPPVRFIVPNDLDTMICFGSPITLAGTYTDDGTFGSTLFYRWEYSLDGTIWIPEFTYTAPNPLSTTYPIASMTNADTGYYRLLVGNSATINQPNCRAAAVPVHLQIGITPPPMLTDTALVYWRHFTAPSLLIATGGAVPISGYTLKWYLSDTTTVHPGVSAPIYTDTAGIQTYFVSQIDNITGCESEKILVRVAVVEPLAFSYIACPGANVTVGVEPIAGVNFYWYAASTGGSPLASATNSYTANNVSPPYTVWVEPREGATVYDRVPITISLSESCGGTPVACAVDGTVLFREDFGGNSPSDPDRSTTPLPAGTTTYTLLASGIPAAAQYGIMKKTHDGWDFANWYRYVSDHTNPNDSTRGYFMLINADFAPGLFYTLQIDDLCDSSNLYFSIWIGNLFRPGYIKPDLRFVLQDALTFEVLAEYITGDIPDTNDAKWLQYGFPFQAFSSSVNLSIYNRAPGGYGNDLILDDIEVRLCAPPVTLMPSSDTTLCAGSPITISGEYTDDGTFGDPLTYRWEYCLVGDINDPNAWTTLSTATGISPLSVNYPILSMSVSDTGYYRLLVGTSASIDEPHCRASSEPIGVWLNPLPVISIAGSSNICIGTTTQLLPTTGGTWQSTNAAAATVTNDGVVTGVSTGSARFIFTSDTTGCSDTTAVVTVGEFPTVADIVATKKVFCIGESITLSDDTLGGVWTSSDHGNVTIGTPVGNSVAITSVLDEKVYVTYTVTDSSGHCQTNKTILLKVVPATPPEIRIGFEE